VQTFASLDKLVMFGDFAEHALRMTTPDFPVTKIPHGVDTSKFYPISDAQSRQAKAHLIGNPDLFLVGTVARNNSRKCLPRLLKAYRMFIQPWTSCGDCGNVTTQQANACNACGSTNVASGGPKTNTRLYIHSTPYDDAGHDLADLAVINRIQDHLIMPRDVQIGRGVSDAMLNRVYNAMDLFTLPTGGEGFGLPIAEAMAAGTPVLVTGYSGHVDFVNGPGEFIHVAEFNTDQCNNAERAIVDIFDYVLKLDTFYLPHEEFVRKWGAHLVMQGGWSVEQLGAFKTGPGRCSDLGQRCHQHIQAWDWDTITPQWVKLICDMLNYHPEDQAAGVPAAPQVQLEFV
jgi:glycosyltransferase involved in cell wall biosynthesis